MLPAFTIDCHYFPTYIVQNLQVGLVDVSDLSLERQATQSPCPDSLRSILQILREHSRREQRQCLASKPASDFPYPTSILDLPLATPNQVIEKSATSQNAEPFAVSSASPSASCSDHLGIALGSLPSITCRCRFHLESASNKYPADYCITVPGRSCSTSSTKMSDLYRAPAIPGWPL